MFRFRLGSIPVTVHPSHLLVSGALALSALSPPPREGWLSEQLADASVPGHTGAVISYVLAWMFIVFTSVLVHELGHAIAFRLFGYQPSIALVWMGGETRPNVAAPLPWHRDVITTAAGPFFGFLLAVGALVASMFLGGRWPAVDFLLQWFTLANFFWTAVNLLPVLPLDGGRISTAIATRLFGARGFTAAQVLALVVCLAIVVWGYKRGQLFLTVFFAMYGFQAFRLLTESARAQANDRVDGPLAQTLQEAQAALAEGRLDDARKLGAQVLEGGPALTPAIASRAHHLLGWVSVKQGQGRPALDHFSQVQGRPVETHALAAAFSLVGDDPRAVTLWELAWRESKDRTVMHELAGALIRMGRIADALKLPGVDPAAAFSCAERVLFIRGAYSEAAAVSEQALRHAPSPTIAYDAACAFSRARNTADALRLLRLASELGFRDADYAASDEDLAPLHGHPAFEAWLTELRQIPAH